MAAPTTRCIKPKILLASPGASTHVEKVPSTAWAVYCWRQPVQVRLNILYGADTKNGSCGLFQQYRHS